MNKYKYENMIQYYRLFFNQIISLLVYVIKIFQNSIMLSKKYPDNYIVKTPNQNQSIKIISDKDIFIINNK